MPAPLDEETRAAIAASQLGLLSDDVVAELMMGATAVTIPARSTIRPVAGQSPHLELVLSGLVRI